MAIYVAHQQQSTINNHIYHIYHYYYHYYYHYFTEFLIQQDDNIMMSHHCDPRRFVRPKRNKGNANTNTATRKRRIKISSLYPSFVSFLLLSNAQFSSSSSSSPSPLSRTVQPFVPHHKRFSTCKTSLFIHPSRVLSSSSSSSSSSSCLDTPLSLTPTASSIASTRTRTKTTALFTTSVRSTGRTKSNNNNNNLSKRRKKKLKNQKIKTYKQIKEEKRQLQSMRAALQSSSVEHTATAATSQQSYSSSSSPLKSPSINIENVFHHDGNNNNNDNDNDIKSKRSSSSSHNNVGQPQQPKHQSSSFNGHSYTNHNEAVTDRIHNIHVIRTSLSQAEVKRSSDRRNKAQQLLVDFTVDGDDNEKVSSPMTTDTASSTKTRKDSSKKGSKNDDQQQQQQVPDTVWFNGNLQEGKGDYVTRWSRGMKVAEPLRKYDPVAAEKLLFRQPAKWLVRNVQIGVPLATWVAGVVYDIGTKQEEVNRKNRARQLLRTISGLGPAIIKGGQALSSRSDLMPSEYLEELQKLQDDVPRFDNELAFDTVERELGVEFDSVFELIGSDPIAAASIGQVYKARLRTNGDLVALKIQRPDCEAIIALDLYVLRWWSGVANAVTTLLNRDINVQSIIDDFGELIYRELDYIAEAANAQRFSELYANEVKDVFVPKVYSELTTSKILTMEWVEGFRLTDNENLEKYGLDRKKLVDTLVQCSLRQILGNGFFHADPHAGNLLVVPDGRLCYLDFGMMSYAAGPQRNGFLLAVVHIVNRDWDELVSMYQRLGFIPEGTDLKPIAVALEKSLPDALNSDISELNFKNIVSQLGDIFYTYPFSLPPFYISIIRCLGVLEGLAIQVDPKARIISEAYPYVASRVLTDTQGELQEALRRLALTDDGKIRWNRLERLLSEAKGSQEYDVSVAVNSLTDYLISEDGEQLLNDFADQIVEGVDSLGIETIGYIDAALRALAIRDEVAAVSAFQTLESLLQSENQETMERRLKDQLEDVLPKPTPTMKQFGSIAFLLGVTGTSSDPSKYIPIVRRLSQEPKIQRISSEIVARLGERILSRGLRAIFGLPPS